MLLVACGTDGRGPSAGDRASVARTRVAVQAPADDLLDSGVAGFPAAPAPPPANACASTPAGTACGPASCRDGVEQEAATCDGAGRCVAGRRVPCKDGRCADATACAQRCDVDRHDKAKMPHEPDDEHGCD